MLQPRPVLGVPDRCAGLQIEQFHPKFWPGVLYLDEDKAFYKAIGDGKVVKGSPAALLNPFSQAWKNVRAAKENIKEHNLKGDGLKMGGDLVINKQGDIVWKHSEKTFGDLPSVDEVSTSQLPCTCCSGPAQTGSHPLAVWAWLVCADAAYGCDICIHRALLVLLATTWPFAFGHSWP